MSKLKLVKHLDAKYLAGSLMKINRECYKPLIFAHKIGFEKRKIFKLCRQSHAQLFQDVFALAHNNFKKDGFFVEFGATDGVRHSNTYLLESKFSWKGILAEPGKIWHSKLHSNRSAKISDKLVWSVSGQKIKFLETSDAALSTIEGFADQDFQSKERSVVKEYEIDTISLNDLLELFDAPREIDFLSIDTEGTELEILKNFNFSKYSIQVISVEHNYTPNRDSIFDLLNENGYTRFNVNLSQYDDWYVKS